MSLLKKIYYSSLLIFFVLFYASCDKNREKPVQFRIVTDSALFGADLAAQEGKLDFSKPRRLEYRFDDFFSVTPNSSLLIEYDFNTQPSEIVIENFSLILNTKSASWKLPVEFTRIQYVIPVEDSFDGYFSIELAFDGKIDMEVSPVFQIRSIGFADRFFGFNMNSSEYNILTPFVSRHEDFFTIDVPEAFLPRPFFAEIEASFSFSGAVLEYSGRRYETFSGIESIYIPHSLFPASGQAKLSGDGIGKFILRPLKETEVFPNPIKADPVLVIVWPRENWRNNSYEVFKWDRFPSLLIFDFADYEIQDRMLKRLAFFVEKAGFRGRLSHDHEIAHLHGWNAHDYKADDLARFFDTARKTNFPLLDEEWELEKILLNEGIIRRELGNITEGYGGIISISREAPEFLRYRFMVHEAFHGLFFIDEDFRDFSRRRWEQFPSHAKRFIVSYFDYRDYDTKDEYLLINEFMGHVLQQSVSGAADYFGRHLPQRLETSWRSSVLPEKHITSGTWPSLASAFTSEAQVFSDYVNTRWGLTAGRVWAFRVR